MGHMLEVLAENTLGAVNVRSNVWVVANFLFSIIVSIIFLLSFFFHIEFKPLS